MTNDHAPTASTSFTLDDAIALARTTHAAQTDTASQPYNEHLLRVMRRLNSEHKQMATALHALLKNTPVTATDPGAAIADDSDPYRLALLDASAMQRLRRKRTDNLRLLDASRSADGY
jgi:(p)ppGpp synthase/HD superfamily hydrolase